MISLKKFINYLILFAVFIDVLNGILSRNYNFTLLSIIYKTFILFLLISQLNFRKFNKNILFVFILIIPIIFHLFNDKFNIIELQWFIRLITIIFILEYYKFNFNSKFVSLFFQIIFFTIVISVLIGFFLGYGYSQYDNGINAQIGTRGFFVAGNELSILYILSSAFLLTNLFLKKKYKLYYFFSIIILILSLLIATKVSFIGIFILIFLIPLSYEFNYKINLRYVNVFKLFRNILIISFVIFLFNIILNIFLYDIGIIKRILPTLNKYDITTVIFSGRNLLLLKFLSFNLNINDYIFGISLNKIIVLLGRSIEIDIIDFFVFFGLLGVFVYFKMFYLFYKQIYFTKSITIRYVKYFILFLLFLISNISGHFLTSGLCSYAIAFFFISNNEFQS